MARSPSVRSLIKNLEAEELREVIVELCKFSKQNKQFLELRLGRANAVDPTAVVTEAKQKINLGFHGRGRYPKLDLASARAAVNNYSKLLNDFPREMAELKLYYVEIGTGIACEYGDMPESFYRSVGSMFQSFRDELLEHPDLYPEFTDRITELADQTRNIGWGFGCQIGDIAADLRSEWEDDWDDE